MTGLQRAHAGRRRSRSRTTSSPSIGSAPVRRRPSSAQDALAAASQRQKLAQDDAHGATPSA
jgi:hypothetical protein